MRAVSVLILLADHFSAESLRHHVLLVYPGAACRVVSSIEGAEPALASGTIDLFITATDFSGEDVLDSLLVAGQAGEADKPVGSLGIAWNRTQPLTRLR